jgi:hypothetical protein
MQISQPPDAGTVWFNPNAIITNILSFSECHRAGMHLSYDYHNDIFILQTKMDVCSPLSIPEGIYACDVTKPAAFCTTTSYGTQSGKNVHSKANC